jgi:hypothetical protein
VSAETTHALAGTERGARYACRRWLGSFPLSTDGDAVEIGSDGSNGGVQRERESVTR